MERCETFHDDYRIEVYTLPALTVTVKLNILDGNADAMILDPSKQPRSTDCAAVLRLVQSVPKKFVYY